MTTSNDYPLSRVEWRLGQGLMPSHFLRQEDSLRSEWEKRSLSQSLPNWGVAKIQWDAKHLQEGQFVLTELCVVLPSGLFVEVKGNALAPAVFSLEGKEGPVTLYLHVLTEHDVKKVDDLLEVRVQCLEIAADDTSRNPHEGCLKLICLLPVKSSMHEGAEALPDKGTLQWEWDPVYSPPLLTLGAFPAFREYWVLKAAGHLALWKRKLCLLAVENSLGVHKRVEARECLRRVFAFEAMLRRLGLRYANAVSPRNEGNNELSVSEVLTDTHPFEFYQKMTEFYFDVFVFGLEALDFRRPPRPLNIEYDHRDVASSFEDVWGYIDARLEQIQSSLPSLRSFSANAEDEGVWTCDVPSRLAEGQEVYWLVQFHGETSAKQAREVEERDGRLVGLKLAAPERLEAVEARTLEGVGFERIRLLPFPHDFSPSVQFYRLEQKSEWDSAFRSGALTMRPGSRQMSCFLYWPDAAGAAL